MSKEDKTEGLISYETDLLVRLLDRIATALESLAGNLDKVVQTEEVEETERTAFNQWKGMRGVKDE